MERQIFHRDDVRNILRAVEEAGNALATEQSDLEFIRGYATALRLIATAFGFFEIITPAHERGLSLTAYSLQAISPRKRGND
nr:hypothetical protein [Chloroflexota bacterium]